MATAIMTGFERAETPAVKTSCLLRRIFARFIEAREHQARLYVNAHLLMLDDETLARAGFDRKELEKEGAVPYAF